MLMIFEISFGLAYGLLDACWFLFYSGTFSSWLENTDGADGVLYMNYGFCLYWFWE